MDNIKNCNNYKMLIILIVWQRLDNTSHKDCIRIISSHPQGKDGNTRFTTVPLKPLPNKNVEDIVVFPD